ncbi:hypothetical protein ASD56_09020 [Microbacterium sp. Root166]|nr:hypothetical protein ASD56_09020 [Microbacterium sp. Root166]
MPFLRSECVSSQGLDMRQSMFISEGADQSLRRSRVKDGDILMTITGNVGRVVRLTGIGSANINQHIARVRIKDRNFDPSFVYHFLSQGTMREYYESIVTGQAYPQISLVQVRSTPMPEIGVEEQKEIARALDDADELIGTLEGLIAKKQAIKQGMMQQLLTGRTRLEGFTEPWGARPLGDLLAYEQPGRYLVATTDYTPSGIPVLTAGKTFILGRTQERNGIFEAVPVIIFDDFTTASKYVGFPFKAKSSAMKMLSARTEVNLRFVFERMQLIDFVAVDHKRRWIAEYSRIQVAVPSRNEQDAVAAVIQDADREIEVLNQRRAKARAIKQGMMQQLLTGRVRLPAEAAA